MKKKIAIVDNKWIVGGVEKACIALLNAIDYSRYEVHLFTHTVDNPYIDEINPNVTVFSLEECAHIDWFDDIKRFKLKKLFLNFKNSTLIHVNTNSFQKLIYTYKKYSLPSVEYDLVISYRLNYPDIAICLYRLNAKKRAVFIHGNTTYDPILYSHIQKFDNILCVSKAIQENISKTYPLVTAKTCVFYNLIDAVSILERASESPIPQLKAISILTVGRLCEEKGQDIIPATVRLLLDAGYDIHWYLVGDGPLRKIIEAECIKHKVVNRVILLGQKENPYPYIKACDVYVQPSRSEGWGLTVQEARILQKPIVVSSLPVMFEQIKDLETGLILDDTSPDAIFRGIKTMLDNPLLMKKIINNLAFEICDNANELQKLYDLLEY